MGEANMPTTAEVSALALELWGQRARSLHALMEAVRGQVDAATMEALTAAITHAQRMRGMWAGAR